MTAPSPAIGEWVVRNAGSVGLTSATHFPAWSIFWSIFSGPSLSAPVRSCLAGDLRVGDSCLSPAIRWLAVSPIRPLSHLSLRFRPPLSMFSGRGDTEHGGEAFQGYRIGSPPSPRGMASINPRSGNPHWCSGRSMHKDDQAQYAPLLDLMRPTTPPGLRPRSTTPALRHSTRGSYTTIPSRSVPISRAEAAWKAASDVILS